MHQLLETGEIDEVLMPSIFVEDMPPGKQLVVRIPFDIADGDEMVRKCGTMMVLHCRKNLDMDMPSVDRGSDFPSDPTQKSATPINVSRPQVIPTTASGRPAHLQPRMVPPRTNPYIY